MSVLPPAAHTVSGHSDQEVRDIPRRRAGPADRGSAAEVEALGKVLTSARVERPCYRPSSASGIAGTLEAVYEPPRNSRPLCGRLGSRPGSATRGRRRSWRRWRRRSEQRRRHHWQRTGLEVEALERQLRRPRSGAGGGRGKATGRCRADRAAPTHAGDPVLRGNAKQAAKLDVTLRRISGLLRSLTEVSKSRAKTLSIEILRHDLRRSVGRSGTRGATGVHRQRGQGATTQDASRITASRRFSPRASRKSWRWLTLSPKRGWEDRRRRSF